MTKSNEYLLEEKHLYTNTINLFEKRLLANEINCIDPYLDKFPEVTAEHLVLITRHGYYIEKLIEHDNEYILADLVRCGHAREYYEDWAKKRRQRSPKSIGRKRTPHRYSQPIIKPRRKICCRRKISRTHVVLSQITRFRSTTQSRISIINGAKRTRHKSIKILTKS